jgi:hypothetical protein
MAAIRLSLRAEKSPGGKSAGAEDEKERRALVESGP